ncbi:MAG TPA: hypothetical protein VGJ05_03115 [Fimbriiglobus sp.]|jgi:hypothetical protein
MSQSGAEGRRRLTVSAWLLLTLLVSVGVISFMYAGMYVGLVLVADKADSQLNQPPPPGSGLAGAGQGAANVIEGILTLGAGGLVGIGVGGLVGIVVMLLACRYLIAPRMRRVAGLSGSPPVGRPDG